MLTIITFIVQYILVPILTPIVRDLALSKWKKDNILSPSQPKRKKKK